MVFFPSWFPLSRPKSHHLILHHLKLSDIFQNLMQAEWCDCLSFLALFSIITVQFSHTVHASYLSTLVTLRVSDTLQGYTMTCLFFSLLIDTWAVVGMVSYFQTILLCGSMCAGCTLQVVCLIYDRRNSDRLISFLTHRMNTLGFPRTIKLHERERATENRLLYLHALLPQFLYKIKIKTIFSLIKNLV